MFKIPENEYKVAYESCRDGPLRSDIGTGRRSFRLSMYLHPSYHCVEDKQALITSWEDHLKLYLNMRWGPGEVKVTVDRNTGTYRNLYFIKVSIPENLSSDETPEEVIHLVIRFCRTVQKNYYSELDTVRKYSI